MSDRHAFRAKWHDYSDGIYFVTICSHQKQHIFGKITNAIMHLSELGKIVSECLHNIPNHFPNTEVWNHVIMPNHIHIVLSVRPVGARYIAPTSVCVTPSAENVGCLKPPKHGESVKDIHHNSQLAQIVGTFKAAVTREYRRLMRARCIAPLPHIWQRLYHEHIIRNQRAYENIMAYVNENPARWNNDVFNNMTNGDNNTIKFRRRTDLENK